MLGGGRGLEGKWAMVMLFNPSSYFRKKRGKAFLFLLNSDICWHAAQMEAKDVLYSEINLCTKETLGTATELLCPSVGGYC